VLHSDGSGRMSRPNEILDDDEEETEEKGEEEEDRALLVFPRV